MWSVPEDNSPRRGSPCGPLLRNVLSLTLESNLLAPGGSHPHKRQMQKTLLTEQGFKFGR